MFYDAIARYYDAENQTFTADLPLYVALAEAYGDPILEVGCGTGRVNLHLAQAGYQTVGVDYSPQMLAIAQRKLKGLSHLADHAQLLQGDIFKHHTADPYALILLSYNALMHFTMPEKQLALLQHLAGLLGEDGCMVIDLPNAGEAYASEDIPGITLERTFIEPTSGNLVMQQSVSSINRAEQLLHVTWIYDEILPDKTLNRTLEPLTLRYVFPTEMRWLLQLAGLEAREIYGDYEQNPFADGADRMIIVAGKA